ncbi:MAG: hypothetical protein LBU32_07680 [Clostridiales bacterium]|nr:hypothetical protein [Clostridiales bacterium]
MRDDAPASRHIFYYYILKMTGKQGQEKHCPLMADAFASSFFCFDCKDLKRTCRANAGYTDFERTESAIDIGILHSLYNQAPKKVILYEKQYNQAPKKEH